MAAGAVTDTYSLELFRKQRSSSGTTPNPYRFGGAWGYINGGSGLQQLGARFYWPDVGRFIQQDPIGEGMNWYGYARGNPVVASDPEGTVVDTALDVVTVGYDAYKLWRCRDWKHAGILGLDLALAVVPFVPAGVGWLDDAARAAEHVHHIFPAGRGGKLAKWFAEHGMPEAERVRLTLNLPAGRHTYNPLGVHTNLGGNWNRAWETWQGANPGATRYDVLRQGVRMMKDFGISQYRRGVRIP
ncbi:MAG: RHS repeat-associated core domain-containing protein [Armatimonadota bacterium]